MDPSPGSAAWGGAKWIGGGNDDLVLYSPYLAIFDVKYAVTIAPGSTRASFVYGANDSRLMDRNKNIYQVAEREGPELHQAGARHLGGRRLAGRQGEAARLPRRLQGHRQPRRSRCKTFEIDGAVINNANKNAEHIDRVPQRVRPDHADDRRQHDVRGHRCAPAAAAAAQARRRRRRPGQAAGRRAERGQPEPHGPGRRLPPVRHALRHGLLGRARARAPRSATSPSATTASPNNILFREDLAAGDLQGHLRGRRQGELRVLGRQRQVRAGGRQQRRRSSCGIRAATRCRCSGPTFKTGSQGDRRAPASTSRRAASTRSS